MGAFLALFSIIAVALLVVRIGAMALVRTGMSLSAAQFQAASAFFGVGFTTQEAEMVVGHAVRRKIILHLIIAGNVGITSALATLVVTLFRGSSGSSLHLMVALGLLIFCVGGFYFLGRTYYVRKLLDWVMGYWLEKGGVVRALDYELLLNVKNGYCVSEFLLEEGHFFVDKSLLESRPNDFGVIVLSITKKDGTFIGTPGKDQVLKIGDTIMVYGEEGAIDEMTHAK